MKDLEVLWKGKWVSVVSPKDAPYEAVDEKDIVLVLPIINNKLGIRLETCPPYQIKDHTGESKYYTIISGKIEGGEDYKQSAFRELKEEAGVELKDSNIIVVFKDLPLCKSTDMRATCVVITSDSYDYEKSRGDGTKYEKESQTTWVSYDELFSLISTHQNIDSLLFQAFFYVLPFLKKDEERFIPGSNQNIYTITHLGNNLYQVNNEELVIDEIQVKNLIKSASQVSDVFVDSVVDSLQKGNSATLKLANKGMVVNLYEVEYPAPKDPNKETQELAGRLNEYNDFVSQYIFPSSKPQDVIIGLKEELFPDHSKDSISNTGKI